MLAPPEKHKFETTCDEFFVNGDKRKVASFVQKDESVLSRQLSPNQEHYNHVIYFFVQCLWAFDCIRRDLGDKVINLVLTEREKWLADGPVFESDADLAEDIGVQFSEFVACRMKGKDYDDQIREANDIVVAATRLEANLIRERAAILTNGHTKFAGQQVSTGARDSVRGLGLNGSKK